MHLVHHQPVRLSMLMQACCRTQARGTSSYDKCCYLKESKTSKSV
jgi:hypothetical protein